MNLHVEVSNNLHVEVSNNIKCNFFQAAVVAILSYECIM